MNLLPHKILKTLLALCLATPLLAFSNVIFPYTVPKVFVFRILVEIAAIFYLYLVLKYPRPASHRYAQSLAGWPARHASWFTSVAGAVGFFLLISFISALFGTDFYSSFWGNLERGMGVFSLLHFAAFFFMLVSVFRIDGSKSSTPIGERPARHASWLASVAGADGFFHQLIKVSVFTSALISLLAILQHFFGLGDLLPQIDRVYSLLGNAGVLGSYLIFNIFLAGYLFFHELSFGKNSFKKFGYCLLIFVSCLALVLSGTRGAWLGLLAGVLIFLSIMVWQSQQKKWRKFAIWGLAVIFVFVTSLFMIRDSSFVKTNPTLYRLTSISLNDGTVQSRLVLWQGAWQAWQSKPLFGFGSENFEIAAAPYLSPRLANFEGYSTDRAHNFIFDYGATIGWLGLLSYLSIFIIAGWLLIKPLVFPLKRPLTDSELTCGIKNNFYLPVIFLSLLAAYLVQNLFIFDSFVSYLMLFFVLACISNFVQSDRTKLEDNQFESRSFQKSLSIVKKIIFILIIGILSFTIYSYNLKPFLAANYTSQILSLPAGEATQAAPLLKNVIALNSFASTEITYQVTLDYIEKISQNQALSQNEEFYNVASAELSRIITRSPSQFKNYIALSWLDLYFSGQEKTRIDQSLQLAQKVRELSPNKKDAYLLLVAGYALSNQSQKALQVVDQAIAIDAKMGEEVKAYLERLK